MDNLINLLGRIQLAIQTLHRLDEHACRNNQADATFIWRADSLEEVTRMLCDPSSMHHNDLIYGAARLIEYGVDDDLISIFSRIGSN